MNLFVSVLLVASSLLWFVPQPTPKVTGEDFQVLTGQQWAGTLTYLDYSSKKKVSIRSNLTVTQSAEDKLSLNFEYQYPDEPKANSKDTVKISKDGKTIDGETVTERSNLADGTLKIVTEKIGRDDNQEAVFRYTYLLASKSFSIKKEARYQGKTDFFERNLYSWKR